MTYKPSSATYLAMLRAGQALGDNVDSRPEVRVSLLAEHAPQQLGPVLAAAIHDTGFFPRLHVAGYDAAALEAYDGASGLHTHRPEFVVYSTAVQKYRERFYEAASAQEREALPQAHADEIAAVIDRLLQAGASVIVSNLALPVERMFGNHGALTAQSLYGSVLQFNALLLQVIAARRACHLNDVAYIANCVGALQFLDERLWSSSKYPCANPYLPEVARSMARVVAASRGRVTKVLALDLDNTLWGGVLGEEGLDGVALGGDAYGEAFLRFQRYLLSLRDRGYVLAVCSKNDEELALDVFRRHPEMLIREEDIAVFAANWNDKAGNLDQIAATLELSTDAFVFIDDSAFERSLVKATLPGVVVPELPDDVADFCAAVELSGALEATGFTHEDRSRSSSYRQEALRASTRAACASLEDYLASLDMKLRCECFRPEDIPRVTQLIQRSTQFNLCTRRLTDAQCEELMRSGEVTVAARLQDRFGDYGLVAAVGCRQHEGDLVIHEFVMSCRVLKRGVEEFLMNHLFAQARSRGLHAVRGEYIRTTRNGMVQDLFATFGFQQVGASGPATLWRLDVDRYQPRPHRIAAL